ncbi:SdrD B-like domain-containing protein [Staphylococcus saccharolyticus]|uniref:SdrD B-like domain-containing protein n=1 Tax=Staphylococcus saccharolyticus TaxID=33028 RepID=UPI0032DF1D6A
MITESASEKNISTQNLSTKENTTSQTTGKESNTSQLSNEQEKVTTKNTISEKDDTPTTQERMSEQSTNSTHHQSPYTDALNVDVSEQKATNKKTDDASTTGVTNSKVEVKTTDSSANHSVADKQNYMNRTVNKLGADASNKNDVGNNIDVEKSFQGTIKNAVLTEAIKEDLNHSDYGADTPLALNSTSSTTSRVSKTSPRMKLMSLAAESGSGTNVNDKVTITNPSISLKKSNSHPNNVIWPTSNEQFNLKANYSLDDSIKEGDTFTIKYGKYIRPGGLEFPATHTQLRSADGSIVANGVYDKSTNTTTYTFTNYVDQYSNIIGSFNLIATSKRETAIKDNQTYPMEVDIANTTVNQDFVVDYGNKKDNTTTAAVANVDNVNNKHNEIVYLNQNNQNPQYAKYFSTVKNGKFLPGEVKVYEVLDTNAMVDSFNPDLNSSAVKDVTSQFTPKYNADGTRVDINFAGNMAKGKKYIVSQAVRPTSTGNVYTEYWLTRDGTENTNSFYRATKSTSVSYLNGSSSASGDTPTYSLGDYVWLDKNGIQDNDEKGISGVKVTLKDGNGNIIGETTTDENGKYQFDNLDSGDYIVHFETPEGLTQTTTNSSDDEKDTDGEDVNVTITDHNDFSIDNGYYDADSDSGSDSGNDSDSNEKLLDTGDNGYNSTLIGSLFAVIGALLLGKRRRKGNKEK